MREFISSIKIEQHKERAVLTANLPWIPLLKKLVTPESAIAPDSPATPAQPRHPPAVRLSALAM